jgi:hypothetical protein
MSPPIRRFRRGRDSVPELKRPGAQGIVELPFDEVIL